MRLLQAPLDTCLDSPFFASLSVHGLHFTAYALSNNGSWAITYGMVIGAEVLMTLWQDLS